MTIAEILAKYEITLPEDKAKAFQADFDKEFRPASELESQKQELTARDTEITGLKTQIKERDKDIKALKDQQGNSEELNAKLAELQSKYDTDTANFTKQIEDMRMDHAIEGFFSPLPFASELARKAAISEFKAKGFKLDNGKFQGGDEFISELKKSDPAAFKPDDKPAEIPKSETPPPQFTRPMSQPPAGTANPFNFSFSAVRAMPTTNN